MKDRKLLQTVNLGYIDIEVQVLGLDSKPANPLSTIALSIPCHAGVYKRHVHVRPLPCRIRPTTKPSIPRWSGLDAVMAQGTMPGQR